MVFNLIICEIISYQGKFTTPDAQEAGNMLALNFGRMDIPEKCPGSGSQSTSTLSLETHKILKLRGMTGIDNRLLRVFLREVTWLIFVFVFCVTKQDPMGSFRDGPFPLILCCSSSLKYLDNISGAHVLSCFTDAETTTKREEINYLMIMSPQTYWHLRNNDAL